MKLSTTAYLVLGADARRGALHLLDPRAKCFCLAGVITASFYSVWGLTLACAICLSGVFLARLPVKRLVKLLWMLKWFFLFILLFHLFYTPGAPLSLAGYRLPGTREGLAMGVRLSARLLVFILATSLLSLTTPPLKLTQGLEQMFRPLSYLGVPVSQAAMLVMLCLGFIPQLLEESQRLLLAQRARGLDFSNRSLLQKAKGMLALFVPLILSAQRRAESLALSLEARGYSTTGRRRYLHPLRFGVYDYLAMALISLLLALSILQRLS